MSAAAVGPGGQMITLTINGQEVQAQPGQTILEVARAAGIDIPTLCYDPRLEPYGACRMCLVEVEGARGPMAACGTAVREGMKVQTHSEKIVQLRRFVLELLLTNHPLDCPVCEAAGDCRLQDYAYEYLVDMVPWGWRGPVTGSGGDHPNIAHFGARCILCGRCVRICREVMAIGCWGYLNRGYDSEVDTPYRLPLQEVGCVSCGQCVSTCPVGAVVTQRSKDGARAWQTTKTASTCGYCADGCRVLVHSYRNNVVKVSAELEKGLNQGNLCVKGRFGWGYVAAGDRVTTPLIRGADGELEETTWEHALEYVSERLAAVRSSRGGQAIAAVAGAQCTNEAAYLLQKLVRSVLGSNNLDCLESGEPQAIEDTVASICGAGSVGMTREELAHSDIILVMGANLTESHPVLALNVIKALRTGKTVVVVDPRKTEIAQKASLHLALQPGGDLAVLRAMMAHIVNAQLQDRSFVETHTEGLEQLVASLAGLDAAQVAASAGVDSTQIVRVAEDLARAESVGVIIGTGVSGGVGATAIGGAIADLLLLTGKVGKPGTGVMVLRSSANSRGVVDMGMQPDRLPGGQDVSDSAALERCAQTWGASLEGRAGLGLSEALTAAKEGKLVALYLMGADPVLVLGGQAQVREVLAGLELLVVQDAFLTEAAKLAHVVLPAATVFESEGTFTNGEGYVQRVRPAIEPKGESVQDWQIVQRLAGYLGARWSLADSREVMKEIASLVPAYEAVTSVDAQGDVLVGVGPRSSGPAVHSAHGLTGAGRLRFVPLEEKDLVARGEEDYPFLLITGSVREHHGTGEGTRRSSGTSSLAPEAKLELNPGDASRLGVGEGARVRVSSRQGSIEVAVKVTDRVQEGVVFLPQFSPAAAVGRLRALGEKGPTAVRLEVL